MSRKLRRGLITRFLRFVDFFLISIRPLAQLIQWKRVEFGADMKTREEREHGRLSLGVSSLSRGRLG